MTTLQNPPVAAEEALLEPGRKPVRRRRPVRGSRPGWFVYAALDVVLLSAAFPFYWSLLSGSGDSYTIRDPNMSWIPGGNFLANAASVVNDPAVNFWPALWNSIYSSTLIAASVVLTSTLAGWAFAKLRFPGSRWLLIFVVATMAVPMQLGVVPLYILFLRPLRLLYPYGGRSAACVLPSPKSPLDGVYHCSHARAAHEAGGSAEDCNDMPVPRVPRTAGGTPHGVMACANRGPSTDDGVVLAPGFRRMLSPTRSSRIGLANNRRKDIPPAQMRV